MGKSKPRSRSKNRSDPTSKPIKPPADPELAALREKRILPILADLQSAEIKKRSAAAKAITKIIEETKCRKLLLREQIVRVLLEQTLTDADLETRTVGWGILRNLALEEEADFCMHLYRQDILTAIEGIVRDIIETIESKDTPLSKLPQAQQDLVWNLTSSVLNLLLSLAEARDEIVDAIIKLPTIVKFIFGLLSLKLAPEIVQNEALLCLTALTEDNKVICEQITANGVWLDRLTQLKDSGSLTGVAACGVLHNIFTCLQWYDHNTPKEGASDAMIIPTLVESMQKASDQSNGTNGHGTNSSPDRTLQLALQITASIATSLQEALEHGSKFERKFEGFGDSEKTVIDDDKMDADEDDEEQDDEASDDDAEMNDDEIQADMDLVTGDGPDEDDDSLQEVTLDRIVRLAAPQVLTLAQSRGGDVQSYALSALNNIAWIVSSIDFSDGHLSSLSNFWAPLAQRAWSEIISPVLASDTADIDLAATITSLAWAICRSVQATLSIQPQEQRKFMALYQASKSITPAQSNGHNKSSEGEATDAFQSLGVKSIGVLGRLALCAPVDLNRELGVFLITILASLPDTPAADAVEALNQIFDIYADKEYAYDEEVFWGNGFYKHLEDILPKAKKMAKGIDKRKNLELRDRADEAVLNLGRFLKYKRMEKSQKD